ncbi:hypothetical protein MPOCJGCO_0439 [Methylobacterium trifolii]|uniref:Sugar kinase n=1 Tax=Methylobacterium trifolii TaxID=1003092 RepID=A0ABQ4TT43_9HYPH|nr:hypothetical protein MPOCJGCO_0439 [Methylobacterium trifolii]
MSATTTDAEHGGPADSGLLAAASRLHGRVLTLGDLMLDIFA